jgi:magnesium-transporting ATPase (P-type)
LLNNVDDDEISYQVKSSNGKISIKFNSQRKLVSEFLKILSLAHECVPETVSKPDGTKVTFYQGPSPDEITLVDFARFQGYDFKETSDI